MSLFRKSLKIGRKVAVIAHSLHSGRDEFKIGKVVAMRQQEDGNSWDCNYAVRFDDGKVGLFRADDLYTEWGEDE